MLTEISLSNGWVIDFQPSGTQELEGHGKMIQEEKSWKRFLGMDWIKYADKQQGQIYGISELGAYVEMMTSEAGREVRRRNMGYPKF